MKLNTNAGPRTNRNILRRGDTIPDPWSDFESALHGSGRPRLRSVIPTEQTKKKTYKHIHHTNVL